MSIKIGITILMVAYGRLNAAASPPTQKNAHVTFPGICDYILCIAREILQVELGLQTMNRFLKQKCSLFT